MPRTIEDYIGGIVFDGLTQYVRATDNDDYLRWARQVYLDVKDVFIQNVRPGENCTFAFPSMIIQPEIRGECFVAILPDRVIVAWRKGLFKKTTVSRIIPKTSIRQASWAVSTRHSSQGAAFLTIVADDTTNIAMPTGKPAVADAVVAAVQVQ
jgi:hypothetical protein